NNAGFLHRGDFGDSFAFAADAGSADGPDASACGGFGAIEDEARDAGVVVDRFRVGHATDGGEASAGCGARAGLDRFRGFLAGLAEMRVKIDESGSDDQTRGVENLGAFVVVGEFAGLGELGDFLPVEKNVQRGVRFRCGVEDAAGLNQKHAKDPFYRWSGGFAAAAVLLLRRSGDLNRLPARW